MTRILIVDDEPAVSRALGRLLRRDGFEVQVAASGAEAIEKLATFHPAVVISDYRMPLMNGAELLAEVRRREPSALTFILSGFTDLGPLMSAAGQEGACRFLTKPWNGHELTSTLKRLLGEAV